MTDQLIDRPSTWGSLGDHERRIRSLEALDDCCAQNDTCTGFAGRVGQLAEDGVELLGYWSLGGGSSPYADTSGNVGGPVDMTLVAHGTAMTPDYTPGALSPSQDDGAVAFNAATTLIEGDILQAADARFQLSALASFTVAAFLKPQIFTTQFSLSLGTWSPSNGGYALGVGDVAGHVITLRGDAGGNAGFTGPAIPADTWTFVVWTYGPTPGLDQIYIDGALAATQTVVHGLAGFNGLNMGGNNTAGPVFSSYNGGVDEAMVWGEALTADQVTQLYLSGACSSAAAEAGMVLTADGSGGTYWAFPTVEVEY